MDALNNIPTKTDSELVPHSSLWCYIRIGLCASLFLIVGLLGWAWAMNLAGAILASGHIVVESNLKKVQHPTGGVVGELLVREGQFVHNGDVVLRLDETVTRSNLAMVTKALDELEGQKARLEAERVQKDSIVFPESLLQRQDNLEIEAIIKGQQHLFEARRTSLQGQKSQLKERIEQYQIEIKGFEAQQIAKEKEIAIIKDELAGIEQLYRKKLIAYSRLTALQREAAKLEGERGQYIASQAQTRGRIAETELQILQLDQNMLTEVLKELRDIDTRIGEYVERKVTAEDQLKRIDIRAPQDGIVHQLAVHTVGGVISPAEILMMVVPQNDHLTVEANVMPQDIDQISLGQQAVVRFSAFNQRTTPELFGSVTRIAAELTKDPQTQASWYVIRIELSDEELKKLKDLKLIPGMPAEVHVQTGERSVLSYFLKPLTDQFARAFREE